MCNKAHECSLEIEYGGEGVMQVGEGKVALMNMEFKRKCHMWKV